VGGDDDGSWHDQQPVIVAAGVAGLVLLALLLWAVIHTSANSRVPDTVPIPSSSDTLSTYTTSSTSSTSYAVPSAVTSQDNPVVTGPTESSPRDGPGGPGTTTETPTTTANPYVTTTPPIAGHV
jgi:cytoskeletal protein RodZ